MARILMIVVGWSGRGPPPFCDRHQSPPSKPAPWEFLRNRQKKERGGESPLFRATASQGGGWLMCWAVLTCLLCYDDDPGVLCLARRAGIGEPGSILVQVSTVLSAGPAMYVCTYVGLVKRVIFRGHAGEYARIREHYRMDWHETSPWRCDTATLHVRLLAQLSFLLNFHWRRPVVGHVVPPPPRLPSSRSMHPQEHDVTSSVQRQGCCTLAKGLVAPRPRGARGP